ncbi:MAG: hypothetical protein KW793_00915 [Candidatus Doudnabacteria bacterium]|nr:hypothetical protein [Candidatus Doudnabacteria bacterium]
MRRIYSLVSAKKVFYPNGKEEEGRKEVLKEKGRLKEEEAISFLSDKTSGNPGVLFYVVLVRDLII